jgi:hypothetical protein
MIKLEKGAKVRVRLHTGEVVEAAYLESGVNKGNHFVSYNGSQYMACRHVGALHLCRFVASPCDLVPVGVSV